MILKNGFCNSRYAQVLISLFFLILSCATLGPEKVWDNPSDPDGINYFPPVVSSKADTTISVNDPLLLTADAFDQNGTVAAFCWSFDYGTNWDTTAVGNPLQKSWSNSEIGMHSVWYCVIDNDGVISGADSFSVDVHSYIPVLIPLQDSSVSQNALVDVNFQVTDTNGTALKYYWKSGAGDVWSDSSDLPEASFANSEGGPLQITWAAVDDDGYIVSDTFTLLFNRGPVSATLLEPSEGITAPFVTFDFASYTGKINFKFSANDPDGEADMLVYKLLLGKEGSVPVQVYSGKDTVYSANGLLSGTVYSWELRVKDLFGDSVETSGQFTTDPPPDGPDGMKFIRSKSVKFNMGQNGFASYEEPIHSVTLSHHFWMDSMEVTVGDFNSVMGLPAQAGKETLPVTGISWSDAALYCNARSTSNNLEPVYAYTGVTGTPGNMCVLEGLSINFNANGYRLPTEAEWEFACKAGTATLFYWGNNRIDITDYAWIKANSGDAVHETGAKMPNSFGLYDMSGNVWEWCSDWYDGTYYSSSPSIDPTGPQIGQERVIRGGSWMHTDYFAQSGSRSKMIPDGGNTTVGFRAVLVVK